VHLTPTTDRSRTSGGPLDL